MSQFGSGEDVSWWLSAIGLSPPPSDPAEASVNFAAQTSLQ